MGTGIKMEDVAYSDTNPGGESCKAGFVLTCEGKVSMPQDYDK